MTNHQRGFSLSTVLVLLALLVGCGTSSAAQRPPPVNIKPIPSPQVPTATMVPLPTLALPWQSRSLIGYPWAFAPTDGATLYSCNQDASAAIFTHDGGVQMQTTTVTVATHGGWCVLLADEGQANVAVIKNTSNGHGPYLATSAAIPHSIPGPGTEVFDLVTRDGGQSWATIPNGVLVDEAATGGDVTYAIITTTQQPSVPHLARSSDGFASWQQLNPPNFVAASLVPSLPYVSKESVQHLWVNPDGQHVLFIMGATIAASADSGQTWQLVALPPGNVSALAVQQPINGHPWSFCLQFDHLINCTQDGGKNWALRGAPSLDYTLSAITPGGDLLAVGLPRQGDVTLLRLPAGGQQWQSLGSLPITDVRYYSTPGNGVLWVNSDGKSPHFPIAGWYETTYQSEMKLRQFCAPG